MKVEGPSKGGVEGFLLWGVEGTEFLMGKDNCLLCCLVKPGVIREVAGEVRRSEGAIEVESGAICPRGITGDVDEVEIFAVRIHHVVGLVEFGGMELGLFAVSRGEGGFLMGVFADFVMCFGCGGAMEIWADCLASGARGI